MDLDDDLGEDGLSRDGIDDFLDENYRRTAERESDHNFIKDNSNQDQSTFSNNVCQLITNSFKWWNNSLICPKSRILS